MQLNIQVIGWIKQQLLVKQFVCQFVSCVIGLELNIVAPPLNDIESKIQQ
jgi:hypothetical protein